MNDIIPYRFPEALITDQERAAVEARFPESDWRYEVNNGDTHLGYEEWLMHRIEGEGLLSRPNGTPASQPLFCIDSNGVAVFIGDRVDAEPKAADFANEFRGRISGFKPDGQGGFYIQVTDEEDDTFDCDSDQVTLAVGD